MSPLAKAIPFEGLRRKPDAAPSAIKKYAEIARRVRVAKLGEAWAVEEEARFGDLHFLVGRFEGVENPREVTLAQVMGGEEAYAREFLGVAHARGLLE